MLCGGVLDLGDSDDAIHVEYVEVFSGVFPLVLGEQSILWCMFPCEFEWGLFCWKSLLVIYMNASYSPSNKKVRVMSDLEHA